MDPRTNRFATEIAAALQQAAARSGLQIKTVARWTGANERTVKNWFAGLYGPSGEHLLVLARHNREVFETVLKIIRRQDLLLALEAGELEQRIARLAKLLQDIAPQCAVTSDLSGWSSKDPIRSIERERENRSPSKLQEGGCAKRKGPD